MNILIVNLHSALNLGDDAIMYETLRGLRVAYPGATITAAANDPASWRKYQDVEVVGSLTTWVVDRNDGGWRWRKAHIVLYALWLGLTMIALRWFRAPFRFGTAEQRALLTAYFRADLVLSCGGGNFYAHRRFSIAFIWSLLTLAFGIGLRKRLILLPQSFGPVEGAAQRLLLRLVLERAGVILVREQQSLDFLRRCGVRTPITLIPDLAFNLPEMTASKPTAAEQGEVTIGVTLMDRRAQHAGFDNQRVYEEAIASTLIELNRRLPVHLYIFVQCYGPSADQDDRPVSKRLMEAVTPHVASAVVLDQFTDALDLKAAYGAMDCIIATRMHTAIFGLSQTIPVVLVGYQPKAFGVMEMFELDRYCCSIETVNSGALFTLVCDVLDNRLDLRSHIASHYRHVQQTLADWPALL